MENWHISPILERYLGSASYALVAVLALGLLATWTVSVLVTRIPAWRRLVLAALRFLVIVLLVVAMLRPERVYTELQRQSATLAILIDRSRSMGLEDTISGNSRWQVLKEALAGAAPGIERLAEQLEIRPYVFDSEVEDVAVDGGQLALQDKPPGDESAYGNALREVLRREDGKRLIAFILAGDGAQQTLAAGAASPDGAAQQLDQAGCPLYTVACGRQAARQARDVAIETMPDDLVVFVKNEISVTGTLRVSGYANRDIPVQLVVETAPGAEQVVATEIYRATQDGEQLRYDLSYVPEQPGEYKVMVRAVAQEGEVTTTNNELPTYLTVLAGGLRVLYLQGEVRREQRFLRLALAASPDIDVALLTLSPRERDSWPLSNLAEFFQPGAFDVYILGDVDSAVFHPGDPARSRPPDLELLSEAVRRGAGLLALGGWHSFRPGGYHKTPLAAVLPVEMDAQIDRFVRQNYGEPLDMGLHLPGPLQMIPAEPWGSRHYAMRLANADENRKTWEKLPPLEGANKFRGVKDGAVILAEDTAGDPLLVAGEPGGRVLAFAGDSTWRWVMQGYGDQHRRFWRQTILWLARKDQIGQENVWVKLDSRRYMTGQRVSFSAGVRSPEGEPVPDAKMTATVLHPDGSRRPLRLVRQGNQFVGTVSDHELPGTYAIEVQAEHAGASLGQYAARFMVYTTDRELSGVTADPTLLENLAGQTKQHGGRMIPPEQLPALIDELAARPMQLQEKVKLTVSYWDRGYLFLLLVGLLATEWFLRKKWRLV